MSDICVPDRRTAYERLLTTQPFVFQDEAVTLLLPVAGVGDAEGTLGYTRLFARDLILSRMLFREDEDYGESALIFLAAHQGRKPDAFTAEEPGKIFHELPGVSLRGRNTLFCACDTTALFLLECAHYARSPKSRSEVWEYLVPRMAAALVYIRAHLEDGLFLEDPRYSGARAFALRDTYWRDCGISGTRGRRAQYPRAHLLVQAQVLAALREMLALTMERRFPGERRRLEGEIRAMREAFRTNFASADPPAALDRDGQRVRFISTDPAHALFYLAPGDVGDSYRDACVAQLSALETPWGWKTWQYDPAIPGMRHGKRDGERLWPFEHAFLVEGLRRHGLAGAAGADRMVARITRKLLECESPLCEYLSIVRGEAAAGGCRYAQLWTIAFWSWYERTYVTATKASR